ncbi:universal stress protein [Rhodovibrio salinarum]|uniref:Universal stress protein n=1 Tax=Rhodovibrio salinarum TaxID=1087 RepID=A0A934QLY2_9PROT|nr:universal stress protein [Rhodovibrio salinarum]MBK1698865.1 universal stress protein [Rhodovibrio salinarum]
MFDKILVPIDTAHESSYKKALPLAAEEARHHGASLTVMTVIPDVEPVRADRIEPEDEQKRLDAILRDYGPTDMQVETVIERGDSVHKTIRAKAEQLGCDLIVMNSHHPELKDYVLGSNASQVVHHAKCSVFVVR